MNDENFVLEFLEEFLSKCGHSGFKCFVNNNDPPDITVKFGNDTLLGVEVTRVYQQVKDIDGKKWVSSEKIFHHLNRFGEKLKKSTENIGKYDYHLNLGTEGYRPIDKEWEKVTKERIYEHIDYEKTWILTGPGFRLSPLSQGNRLCVTVNSSGPHNIDRVITTTLRCSLESKERGIQRWNGNFLERWLLLLNYYEMIYDNDFPQVEKVVRQYAKNYRDLTKFNGIMWSGFPDRTLKPISLSESS